MRGITLTETLVVIAILVVLALAAIPVLYHFQDRANLDTATSGLASSLRLAKSRTVSSEGDSQWGVYLNLTVSPHQYTIFKGPDYVSRDTAFDEVNRLPAEVEMFNLNLAGASQEVVFQKVSGKTSQYGDISLRLSSSPTEQRTIYVENSGRISFSTAAVDDTNRVKDSRRVHFIYDRWIDTAAESIFLDFDGGPLATIVILNNMSGGQLFWSGEVDVGGNKENITIHTLRLNNPDTLFCVHRDRRFNDVGLKIDISGDLAASPDLIYYFADGSTIQGNSLNVSEPIWQ